MWDRRKIKAAAAEQFPKNYLMCVILSFVGMALLGGFQKVAVVEFLEALTKEVVKLHLLHVLEHLLFFFGEVIKFPFEGLFAELGPVVRGEEVLTTAAVFLGIRHALLHMVLPAHLLHLAVEFLLGLPYEVGLNRYFLKVRQGEKAKFTEVFHGFTSLRGFENIVLAQVLREILTFLFKLLLYFPGVRHHYELFCVPFILAENPNIGWRHAHHLSEKMTHGYKWHLFCLEYSFLGWMILDALTFHILGVFYLKPRMHATFAEAYARIRENAFQKGIVTEEELPGVTTAVTA